MKFTMNLLKNLYGRRLLLALLIPLNLSSTANATTTTTMTFDNLPGYDLSRVYEESGYQVTGDPFSDFGSFGSGGLHMEICCGPYSYTAAFSATNGRIFSLKSLDLLLYPTTALVPASEHFVTFTGYLNGAALTSLSGGSALGGTVTFGSAFSFIDSLMISTNIPPFFFTDGSDLHFNVDNITVSAVPLPASIPLLATGLGILGLFGWRKRAA